LFHQNASRGECYVFLSSLLAQISAEGGAVAASADVQSAFSTDYYKTRFQTMFHGYIQGYDVTI
jgi:hypothetical protein